MKEFTCRWYKTWRGCRKASESILGDLTPCIAMALPEPFCKEERWCVTFYKSKPCGILKCGIYKEQGTISKAIPFVCDISTTRKHKGAGESLFLSFLQKNGTTFWLKCLDKSARMFWQHMGRKHKISFKTVGRTSWNTSILKFCKEA